MATFTSEQIAEARRRAKQSLQSGSRGEPSAIIGADPKVEYRVLDLSAGEGRLNYHRDRLEREGWIKLDDPPKVAGINKAEVWGMPRDLYLKTHWAAQVERDQAARLRTRGRAHRML